MQRTKAAANARRSDPEAPHGGRATRTLGSRASTRFTSKRCGRRSSWRLELLDAVAKAFAKSVAWGSGTIAGLIVRALAQVLEQGNASAGRDCCFAAAIALRDKSQLEESDAALFNYTESATKTIWDFDTWRR